MSIQALLESLPATVQAELKLVAADPMAWSALGEQYDAPLDWPPAAMYPHLGMHLWCLFICWSTLTARVFGDGRIDGSVHKARLGRPRSVLYICR